MANPYKISLKAYRRVLDKAWPLEHAILRDERINALVAGDKELVYKLLDTTLRHRGEILRFLKADDYILELGAAALKILQLPVKETIDQLAELDEDVKYRIILNRLAQKEFIGDIKLNYPNWMRGSWLKAYGEEKLEDITKIMMHCGTDESVENYIPSTETGNIAFKPEILWQRKIEDVKTFVTAQNQAVKNAYKNLDKGEVFIYRNLSLQYEEGEGLVKKLDATKWLCIDQSRILPCLDAAGNVITGSYTAKLQKQ